MPTDPMAYLDGRDLIRRHVSDCELWAEFRRDPEAFHAVLDEMRACELDERAELRPVLGAGYGVG